MAARNFRAREAANGQGFTERRIHCSSGQRTFSVTLGPASRVGFACVIVACVGWTGFTSWAFLDKAMDGRTAQSRLEAAQDAHEIQLSALREQQRLLEEELNRSTERGDAVTRQLSEKQRLLVETAERFQSASAELEGLRAEVETLSAQRRDEQARVEALTAQVSALELSLAEADRSKTAMDDALATVSRTISEVIAARDSANERVRTLDGQIAALEDEVGRWRTRHETLIAEIEQATSASIEALDEVFVNTDIDIDDVLRETRREYIGRGGPFEPSVDDRRSAADDQDGERVAALMTDLERIGLMRVAIDRLPFGMPTRGARLTSDFGPRRDPFRRRTAMHEGIDFAAPRGTPIYATAEGVVVFSGRQRGYGNIVKIRHAFGFETVYAHLSKSRVEVGQRVERGALIADMGSTGRSTGSHLHYEVRIDGQAINPNKFIGAARHVL